MEMVADIVSVLVVLEVCVIVVLVNNDGVFG